MKIVNLKFFKIHWTKFLAGFLFIILFGAYANIFAVFYPGETLNPGCPPSDPTCHVVATSETDPYWTADKSSYSTKAVADTLYKSISYVPDLSSYSTTTQAGNLYLGISAKATDADLLDGHDTSYFQSALGFTPYNATNPSGYISGINSSAVTTALGFTPYNSTNPSNFITDGNTGWDNSYGFITGYTESDPLVSAWAKAGTKPIYTASEVGLGNVTNESKATMFTSPVFTGTVGFGNMNITGDIIPTANNTYVLGSLTNMWKDFYVGPGSIYVNGQKVLQTDLSDSVVVSADSAQNLILKTTGGGNIELNPAVGGGAILMKSNVTLTAGKTFRVSDLSPVIFSDGLSTPSITTSVLNGGIAITPNGTGNTYVTTGNFGIGTTTPGKTLDVAGNTRLRATSTDTTLTIGADTGFNPKLGFQVNGSDVAQYFITGGNTFWDYAGNMYFRQGINGSTSMYLASGGNVGIGTTSPGQKLEVSSGNIKVSNGTSSSTEAPLIVQNTNAFGAGGVYSQVSQRWLNSGGTSDIAYLRNDGLFYAGKISSTIFNNPNYGSTGMFIPGEHEIRFDEAGVSSITIKNGNVGIGTTTPANPLDVVGNIHSSTSLLVGAGSAGLTTSGATDIKIIDGAGNTTFRGIRSNAWADSVNSSFFQIGNSGDNVVFSSSTGTRISRLQLSSTVTQIGGGAYNTIPAPITGDLFELYDNSNNARMVVQQGGNVGIGTTNPVEKLHVVGNIVLDNSQINFINTAGGVSNRPFIKGDGNGTTIYSVDNDPGDGINFKSVDGSNLMFIGSQNIGGNKGLVGIGTINPTAKLDVSASPTATVNGDVLTGINLTSTSNWGAYTGIDDAVARITTTNVTQIGLAIKMAASPTANPFELRDSTNALLMRIAPNGGVATNNIYSPNGRNYLTTGNGTDMVFGTNAAERMRILYSNGNVGIGTTTPGEKLDVNGNINFGGELKQYGYRIFGSTGTKAEYNKNSYYTSLGLFTNNNERLSIDSAGNVGIGTTTPGKSLDVVGDIRASLGLYSGNGYGVYFGGTTTKINGNSSLNTLGLYTNSVEAVHIDNLGNVGIGTTSPTFNLEVNGAMKISGTAISGVNLEVNGAIRGTSYLNYGSWLTTQNGGNGTLGNLNGTDTYVGSTKTGGNLLLYSNNTEAMRILANGNVGIGTTSPTEKLDVNGNIAATNYVYIGGKAKLSYNGNSAMIYGMDGFQAQYYNGSTFPIGILLNNQGNVGIGTTSPSYPLDVYLPSSPGAAAMSRFSSLGSTRIRIQGATGYSSGFELYNGTAQSWYFTSPGDTQDFKIQDTNNIARLMILQSNGNVGIGTTNPASKLTIGVAPIASANYGTLSIGGGAFDGSTAGKFAGSASGTSLAVNEVSGYLGSFMDLQKNGASFASIDNAGNFKTFGYQQAYHFQSPDETGHMYLGSGNGVRFTTGPWNGQVERMRIDASGNVGIGTTGPSYKLQVGNNTVSGVVARFENSAGYCDINPLTTSLTCTSDINLKKNITILDGSTLDKVLNLNPVIYNWKTEGEGDSKHIGFIAQEMEQVFPDLVFTDSTTGLKSVAFTNLIPYTVEAIKEMDLKITNISDESVENTWRSSIVAWFASTTNGIGEFVGGILRAKDKLCIGEGAEEVCITKEELLEMKMNSKVAPVSAPAIEPGLEVKTDTEIKTDTEVKADTEVKQDTPALLETKEEITEEEIPTPTEEVKVPTAIDTIPTE